MSKLSNPPPPDYKSWLTKQQAAQVLQVAEKTIDRMAKSGELQKETLKRPRQVPISVFHPGDVERAKAARGPVAFVMSDRGVQRMSNMEAGQSKPLGDRQVSTVSTPLPETRVRLAEKVYLTISEASEYSGFGTVYLRRLAAERGLAIVKGAGPHGADVLRRADLEKL